MALSNAILSGVIIVIYKKKGDSVGGYSGRAVSTFPMPTVVERICRRQKLGGCPCDERPQLIGLLFVSLVLLDEWKIKESQVIYLSIIAGGGGGGYGLGCYRRDLIAVRGNGAPDPS